MWGLSQGFLMFLALGFVLAMGATWTIGLNLWISRRPHSDINALKAHFQGLGGEVTLVRRAGVDQLFAPGTYRKYKVTIQRLDGTTQVRLMGVSVWPMGPRIVEYKGRGWVRSFSD